MAQSLEVCDKPCRRQEGVGVTERGVFWTGARAWGWGCWACDQRQHVGMGVHVLL